MSTASLRILHRAVQRVLAPAALFSAASVAVLIASATLMLAPAALLAQPAVVRIDVPGSKPDEVTIAINPTNPDNLIAGANLRFVFRSFDGGKTWTQSLLPNDTYGDPCVIFDGDGRAFFAHLTVGWEAITVRRSLDGGLTWSSGVKLRGPSSPQARPGSLFNSSLQDKEWLVADMTTGPTRGNIYATWTDFTRYGSQNPADSSVIVFARSTDHGETFDPFVRISDKAGDAVDSDNTVEGAVPAVGPGGEVYVAWAGPDGLSFDRSLDAGVTWGTDRIISDMPGGWDIDISGVYRANGLPITVADISNTPTRGTVYVNWVDARHGDHDVFVARSTDRGETWSAPIRVNDDPVANGREQFFTWATVDPITGELVIVFYDRRDHAGDTTSVYLARSLDGGRTFRNERIDGSAFYPTPFVFMGDYNCVAAYNGRVRPIWTRLHNTDLSIHTALIDETVPVDPMPAPPSGLRLDVHPNPIAPGTARDTRVRIDLPEASHVVVRVHDMVGHAVATLHDGWCVGGTLSLPLDTSRMPAGTYLVRMQQQARGDGTARETVLARVLTVLR